MGYLLFALRGKILIEAIEIEIQALIAASLQFSAQK